MGMEEQEKEELLDRQVEDETGGGDSHYGEGVQTVKYYKRFPAVFLMKTPQG